MDRVGTVHGFCGTGVWIELTCMWGPMGGMWVSGDPAPLPLWSLPLRLCSWAMLSSVCVWSGWVEVFEAGNFQVLFRRAVQHADYA